MSVLHEFLDRLPRWGIEYHGFLSNHIGHALIVLHRGGASREEMEAFYHTYTAKLDAAQDDPTPVEVTPTNWRTFVNRERHHFSSLQRFFTQQVDTLGVSGAVRTYAPHLLPGLAGALLHTVIHTGLAVEAGHAGMVAQGLAYMASRHQPLSPTTTTTLWSHDHGRDVFDVVRRFCELATAGDYVDVAERAAKSDAYMALGIGRAQQRVVAFDDDALPLGRGLNACMPLRITPDVLERCMVLAAAVYLASDCEFVCVHGATSLHAVLALLPHLDSETQQSTIAYWLRALLAAYTAERLTHSTQVASLVAAWEAEPRTAGDVPGAEAWRDVLVRSRKSTDEHVQKGVYVMWQWAQRSDVTASSVRLFHRTAANQVTAKTPAQRDDLAARLWFSQ